MNRSLVSACLLVPLSATAAAQDTSTADIIHIWGQGMDQIGLAQSATEGVVGYDDISTRPIGRVGELVEVIPGMIATQHSGTGKANQYFMRGFNLDHGTDFAGFIDGAPVNMRSHGHGQGYLDLNPLIPEFVSEIRFRKGAYRADDGDFSLAGSARFALYQQLPSNFASLEIGEFGYSRAAAGVSHETDAGALTFGGEHVLYDGPWSMQEDAERINLLACYVAPAFGGDASFTLMYYDADWRGADQIPERALNVYGRFGVIDPTLGGQSERLAATARWENHLAEVNAWIVRSDFTLYSNFTYFLEGPVNGDQFEQRDERWMYGARYRQHAHVADSLQLSWGAELRHDDIGEIGLHHSRERERLDTVREDAIEQTSFATHIELNWQATDALRVMGGLRADWMQVDVDARTLAANGGTADDDLLAPKFGLAWRASPAVELYANYGRGFHSNDARGATITLDPSTVVITDPAEPLNPAHHVPGGKPNAPAVAVPLLVPGDVAELGVRWQTDHVHFTAAAFWLALDSELVFVGDGGSTEPNDGSERHGFEAAMFWTINDWLVADLEASWTDARFKTNGSEDHIPGAVETVLSGGLIGTWDDFTLSVRVRHFGEAPLIEDGSVLSDPTTLVNLGGEYRFGSAALSVDVFNLFDAQDADITYFIESRLATEATAVEDRHLRSVEPRQIRAAIRWQF
jgi:outer membrane receptor protein involved in Fe transport